MKRLMILITAATFAVPSGGAVAHPTDVPYATRGECEVAYAEANKTDRDFLVSKGVFDNNGQFQMGVRDLFECQYNEEAQAWYIVYIGPAGRPGLIRQGRQPGAPR